MCGECVVGGGDWLARIANHSLSLSLSLSPPTGQPEVVFILLNAGLNPRQKDSYGQVCNHATCTAS